MPIFKKKKPKYESTSVPVITNYDDLLIKIEDSPYFLAQFILDICAESPCQFCIYDGTFQCENNKDIECRDGIMEYLLQKRDEKLVRNPLIPESEDDQCQM